MADIAVETFDVDIPSGGGTHTLTNDVGSLSNAFVKINSSTDKSTGGRTGFNSTINPNTAHAATTLTATDTLTFTNPGNAVKAVGEVWRYTGSPGGANEFISRGTYAISVGAATSGSAAVSGIVDRNKCVPFMVGVETNAPSSSEYEFTTFGVYIDSSGNVVAERSGAAYSSTVYVNVVEFTGSNWSIGHGVSSNHDTAAETITLNTDSTGSGGSTFDVGDWETAFIEATGGGDSTETGLADIMFLCYPGASTTQAVVDYQTADAAARNDASAYVHVIQNDSLIVKRATDTNVSEGNNTYGTVSWPTGASTARNIDELALEWFVSTSGTGTAHKRGSLVTRITDAAGTITHWVHRSGNTVVAYYGVIDLSQLTSSLNNYTLTAESGTVITTGTDANLIYNRVLPANSGAMTVTGTDAALAVHRVVTAEPGSVDIVGSTANLLYDRVLSAESGIVSITGTDASLESSREVFAEPGAVVITGTNAGLIFNRVLNAEPGAVSISGSDASFLTDYVLGGEPGAVLITGTDATLEYNQGYALNAEPGSVVITGTDARATFDTFPTPAGQRKYYLDSSGNLYWVFNQALGLVEKL